MVEDSPARGASGWPRPQGCTVDVDRGVAVSAARRLPRRAARRAGRASCSATCRLPTGGRARRRASSPRTCRPAMLFVRNPTGISHAPAGARRGRRRAAGEQRAGRRAARSWPDDRPVVRARLAAGRSRASARRDPEVSQRTDRGRAARRRAGGTGCRDWCCPGWPTPTATPSTGRCAGAPTPHGGTFWTWRDAMYRSPSGWTRTATARWPRPSTREMPLRRRTRGRRVPLPAHPRRAPLRRPERDGPRAADAAAAAGHPADAAGHAATSPGGIGQALEPVQQRFADGDARRLGGTGERRRPRRRPGRVGAAVHSVRAVPVAALPVVAGWAAGQAAARAPVRATGGERGLPRRVRPHTDRSCWTRPACSARHRPPCTPPT